MLELFSDSFTSEVWSPVELVTTFSLEELQTGPLKMLHKSFILQISLAIRVGAETAKLPKVKQGQSCFPPVHMSSVWQVLLNVGREAGFCFIEVWDQPTFCIANLATMFVDFTTSLTCCLVTLL